MVINLFHNAVKYTPENGAITLILKGDPKEIWFEIANSGPAIPEDQREAIFDKFTRIRTEKQDGTGLGLPIAKQIVELHKGNIRVESEEGKGTRFIVTIPRDLKAPI